MTSATKVFSRDAAHADVRVWLPNPPALIALLVFAIVLWPTAVLNDNDTWWHLSAGDWIWRHHAAPHADPFSYTFAGKPWIAHEWLSELLMSRAFAVGGWPGIMLLTAVCAAAGVWIVARQAARSLSGLALWLCVLGGMALFGPHLLARPHILVLPVMAAWFAALSRARHTPPWACLPLMVLWANMHGSFIAGIALIASFALEALLAPGDRKRTLFLWTGFTAAAIVTALLTPFGIDGLLFPLKLITMPGVDGIGEWSPVDLTKPQPILVVALGFAAVWWLRRPRLTVVRLLTLVGLFAASLHQQRHEMLLGLLGILLLAEPLGKAMEQSPITAKQPVWPALAAGFILAAVRLSLPIPAPLTHNDPAVALAHVPADVLQQRVFNAYPLGGYLIRAGQPVYIDSRADMYGPAFLDHYALLASGDPRLLAATLDQWHAGWTLLTPGSAMADSMDHMPGWHRLYSDATAIVHVRNSPPAP